MTTHPHSNELINGAFGLLGAILGAGIALVSSWATITASQNQSVAETVRSSCTASLQQVGLAQNSYEESPADFFNGQWTLRSTEAMLPFADRADVFLVEAKKDVIEWRLVTKEPGRLDELSSDLFAAYRGLHGYYEARARDTDVQVGRSDTAALKVRFDGVRVKIGELEKFCRAESGLPER